MTQTIDILIAEDDENDRFLVSRAFANNAQELSFTFAGDGQEAIDHLQSVSPARLLLLDIRMPRLDGFQVLEWLAANPDIRPGRVVVLTSSIDPKDQERSLQLGADLHLTKPHDSREYVRIARSLLDEMAPAANSSETSPPGAVLVV
jgi:CheY-like chemotaxis protein